MPLLVSLDVVLAAEGTLHWGALLHVFPKISHPCRRIAIVIDFLYESSNESDITLPSGSFSSSVVYPLSQVVDVNRDDPMLDFLLEHLKPAYLDRHNIGR